MTLQKGILVFKRHGVSRLLRMFSFCFQVLGFMIRVCVKKGKRHRKTQINRGMSSDNKERERERDRNRERERERETSVLLFSAHRFIAKVVALVCGCSLRKPKI